MRTLNWFLIVIMITMSFDERSDRRQSIKSSLHLRVPIDNSAPGKKLRSFRSKQQKSSGNGPIILYLAMEIASSEHLGKQDYPPKMAISFEPEGQLSNLDARLESSVQL
jgi:hypothetical protein